MEKTVHHGRNIKRIREIQGVKQEALALELGGDWNQKKISLMEGKEVIDDELIDKVAKALKVSPEAIKSFDEEAAINIISTTFTSHDNSTSIAYQSTLNFNPIDKIVELYDQKTELYERMLKDKNEMLEKLERLLNEKK